MAGGMDPRLVNKGRRVGGEPRDEGAKAGVHMTKRVKR